ncbi:MAG: hypothetical protein KJN72_12320 [Woeseia sp.]|nr:hypothetical protein [Woeseia sp.]
MSIRMTGNQKINGNFAYVIHHPGQGTYLEYALVEEEGVFPAPCELNGQFVVEEYPDPEHRALWDNMTQDERRSAAIGCARAAGLKP